MARFYRRHLMAFTTALVSTSQNWLQRIGLTQQRHQSGMLAFPSAPKALAEHDDIELPTVREFQLDLTPQAPEVSTPKHSSQTDTPVPEEHQTNKKIAPETDTPPDATALLSHQPQNLPPKEDAPEPASREENNTQTQPLEQIMDTLPAHGTIPATPKELPALTLPDDLIPDHVSEASMSSSIEIVEHPPATTRAKGQDDLEAGWDLVERADTTENPEKPLSKRFRLGTLQKRLSLKG